MKRKQILLSIPLLGLLLASCEVPGALGNAWDKTKNFVNDKIVDPVKDVFNGDSNKTENKENEGEGNHGNEGEGGEQQEAVAISITELLGLPASVEQGSTLGVSGISAKVLYSDESVKTMAVTRIQLDTSKVGDKVVGKAYVNELYKEFNIKVVAKEVPPAGETITPQQAMALMDEAGEGVVVSGLQQVKGICAQNSKYDSQYKQYTTGFDGVSNFKLQFTDTKNILNGGSPDGMEIVVEGYLEKYQGKYQLSYLPATASPTGEKYTPNLVSAKAVTHEGVVESISVSESHREFYVGSSFVGETVTAHYSDGSTAIVSAQFSGYNMANEGKQTVSVSYEENDVVVTTSYEINILHKDPVVGGAVYTFSNSDGKALNMSTWDSSEFMKHVVVDGSEIITGLKSATNAYIGGNGGSGDATWNIWNCLKVGKSGAMGEAVISLDSTAGFDKIKVSAIGARDDGTLTINGVTKNVTKKAIKGDLEPIELEYDISGGISELKFSSKDASSNNYGICITRLEFVSEGPKVPVLNSIELTKSPNKVDYYAGESFDPTGMVVTAKYSNGGQDKVLQPGEYSVDKTVLGLSDTFVVVSYTEDNVTQTVKVYVSVTKAPVPVTGISLDKDTLSIKINDNDVSLVATVEPANADDPSVVWSVSEEGIVSVSDGVIHAIAVGEVTVTATAGNFHADCLVTVAAPDKIISNIEISKGPNKTSYVEGEAFDPTGMEVTIIYSSEHEPQVISSGFTYSRDPLSVETTSVDIEYNGFHAEVLVSVSPAPVLDSISVANAPGKTNSYTEGDTISKSDLVVTAHYTQGKEDAVVTDYNISKTTALAVGDTSVTITYSENNVEKTATYSFTVQKSAEPRIDVSGVDSYELNATDLKLDSYADGSNSDLAWTMLCKGNNNTLQGNSSKSSEIHNLKAFSKEIKYVKFNIGYAAGAAATGSIGFGSSAKPTGNTTSYGANTSLSLIEVGSFTVNAPAGCKFFSVVWRKGASYFSSIEIHFEEMGEQEQVAVQSVSLSPSSTSIDVGASETLVANVLPANATNKQVTWTSNNSSIASVDASGTVTGVAQGTAVITATTKDGGKTATCTITVTKGSGTQTSSTPIDLKGDSTIVFKGVSYSKAIKAGTGKVAGSTSISVPSDAKKLVVYIAGWNGESVKVSASGNGLTSKTLTLTSDSGVSGNGPTYTIGSTTESSFKFEIDVSSLTGGTLSLAATSGKRFVVWNASYTK